MKVRYTITNVQFVPGAQTAEASVRAKLGESFLEHQSVTVPVESIGSVIDLANVIDGVLKQRLGIADAEFETVLFSQRAGFGL